MFDALTLDQIQTFLRVVDAGSFSRAARAEGRATSAVTYAVRKMEDQLGVALFSRAEYRPQLTDAGRALLPRARRIADEVAGLRLTARAISAGVEPQIVMAVDAMFPMDRLIDPLRDFQAAYPGVQMRILVDTLGGTVRLIADGHAAFGIATDFALHELDLVKVPIADLTLVMVAAPSHPLARMTGPVTPDALKQYVQLVLSDRTEVTGARDFSVFSGQTWRLSDLGAKHDMLRAGLGFGSLPAHMIADDLAAGRLVELAIAEGFAGGVRFPMVLTWQRERAMGPATRWLTQRLARTDGEKPHSPS
jgi:DNA-binding transcriptional LysR family regulator